MMHLLDIILIIFYISNYYVNSITIYNNPKTFTEALRYCSKNGTGNLVTLKNEQEVLRVSQELSSRKIISAWIGLTSFGNNDKLYWVSGYPSITVQLWSDKSSLQNKQEETGRHSLNNDNNCVSFSASLNNTYYSAKSINCLQKLPFVCLKNFKISTGISNGIGVTKNKACPPNFIWTEYGCYKKITKRLSWIAARTECKNSYADSDLAIIRSSYQNDYLSTLFTGKEYWLAIRLNNVTFTDSRNNVVNYTNWGPKQPQSMDNKRCTYICSNKFSAGYWFLEDCNKTHYSICEVKNYTVLKKKETPKSPLFYKESCSAGYYYYSGSCYQVLPSISRSQNVANIQCQKLDQHKSELVSDISLGRRAFILSLLRLHFKNTKFAWLYSSVSLNFTKDNEVIATFSNSFFTEIQLNLSQSSAAKRCFMLNVVTGEIMLANSCDDSSGAVVCTYPLSDNSSSGIQSRLIDKRESPLRKCDDKWIKIRNYCFFIPNRLLKESESSWHCKSYSAHLAFFDRDTDNFFTKHFSKISRKVNQLWIGLQVWFKGDIVKFKWINGESIEYLRISLKNRPQTWQKMCVVKRADGMWYPVLCQNQAEVLCQKTLQPYPKAVVNKNTERTSVRPAVPITTKSTTVATKVTSTTSSTTTTTTTAGTITTTTTNRRTSYRFPFKTVYNNFSLNWNNARDFCTRVAAKGTNGYLAVFNEYKEMIDLHGLQNTSDYWIGLSGVYNRFDNVFLNWNDGSRVNFQNYDYDSLLRATGQSENCVSLRAKGLKWLVNDCTQKKPFICSIIPQNYISKRLSYPSNMIAGRNRCPKGFTNFNEKCYYVVEDKYLSWNNAFSHCRLYYRSSLAVISSKYENSFVYSLLSRNYYNSQNSSYWISGKENHNANHFQNPDCPAVSGHPDPYIGARWYSLNCRNPMKFICSLDLKRQYIQRNKICKGRFKEYSSAIGTSCYWIQNHINTLEEAEILVKNWNNRGRGYSLRLLTLQSHYHLHFLLSILERSGISRDQSLWLGARFRLPEQDGYHWQWSNGQPIRYSVWNIPPNITSFILRMRPRKSSDYCFYFIPEIENGYIGMRIVPCRTLRRKMVVIVEYEPRLTERLNYQSRSNKNCLNNEFGTDYKGNANISVNGNKCKRWDLMSRYEYIQYFRRNRQIPSFPQYHSNECRNLNGSDYNKPVCVTDLTTNQMEPCQIHLCRYLKHKLLSSLKRSHLHNHKAKANHAHSKAATVMLVLLLLIVVVIIIFGIVAWRRYRSDSTPSLFTSVYFRSGRMPFTAGQQRGTSFNNPIYRPVNN